MHPKFQKALEKTVQQHWDFHGVMPSAVYGETPYRLLPLMFESESRTPRQLTPVEVLTRTNRDRAAKGLKPVGNVFGMTFDSVPNAKRH